MADIKLTLSTDPGLRAQSIEEEADWMREEGKLSYPLPSQPKYAEPGCWVYFIREGRLVARAIADNFVETTELEEEYTYTGVPSPRKSRL